jgi:hypothetical protein
MEAQFDEIDWMSYKTVFKHMGQAHQTDLAKAYRSQTNTILCKTSGMMCVRT